MVNSSLLSVLDTVQSQGLKKAPRTIIDDDDRPVDERLFDLHEKAFVKEQFLTLEEEVFCGRLMKVAQHEDATRQDKVNARKASEILTKANSRLVLKLANKMYKTMPTGTTREDCIAAGNLGLAKAINRYDPELGYKVSTIATWWIRHYLQRFSHAIARAGHVPVGKLSKVAAVHKDLESIKHETGQLSVHDAQLREVLEKNKLSMADYEMVTMFNLGSISMDAPMTSDTDTFTVGDVLKNEAVISSTMGEESFNDVECIHDKVLMMDTLKKIILELPPVQRDLVVSMYFKPEMGDKGELRKSAAQARREVGVGKTVADKQFAEAMETIRKRMLNAGYDASELMR